MKFILDVTLTPAGEMSKVEVADGILNLLWSLSEEEEPFGIQSYDGCEPESYG